MIRKLFPFTVLFILLTATTALALFTSYNYISASEVKENLSKQVPMTLVDIQVEEEFKQHHIIGAEATYAYPVKSDSDRHKLTAPISTLKTNDNLAIIVCPRGGGGAKRAYDFLVDSGIAEKRVFILTDGQAKWPFPELLAPAQH